MAEQEGTKKTKSKGERSRSDAQDEIKKFKENLLQSVSTGDSIISESGSEIAIPQQSRSRSASKAREALSIPANISAELDDNKIFELKEVAKCGHLYGTVTSVADAECSYILPPIGQAMPGKTDNDANLPAFLLFDLDGDGCIDYNDLRGTLVSLGDKIDDNCIRNMLAEAPNPLDFDGFVNLLGYKTLELDSEETLVAALSRWDKDNSGYISEEGIRHDLMTWGDKFTEKEADYALDEAPMIQKNGQTMIDYVRFCSQLCGLRKATKTQS